MNKVNILGVEYTIIKDEELENADGICDSSIKVLKVCKTLYEEPKSNMKRDLKKYAQKVLRHEVIHAFQYESGLDVNANWDTEQMVDYFAIQYPKMKKAFEQLCIEE